MQHILRAGYERVALHELLYITVAERSGARLRSIVCVYA
jgi:hypothetical protein